MIVSSGVDELLENAQNRLQMPARHHLLRSLLQVRLQEPHERGNVALSLPKHGREERGEDGHVGWRQRQRVHLHELREQLKHVRRKLNHVVLEHHLERREERLLDAGHRGRVRSTRVPDERRDGLKEIVAEGGVARVLRQLHQHRGKVLDARRRCRPDGRADERHHAHQSLHTVVILGGVGKRKGAENVGQHRLQMRRHIRWSEAQRRAVSQGQETLEAVCSVRVHDVLFRAEESNNRREHVELNFARDL
mmetsp:Transcript_18430/g.59978  ORF Transcript_18430/g.59978 Transcript_18430/m.59978 type:complete len:250 (+) Transcript_18430:1352-2101(+)